MRYDVMFIGGSFPMPMGGGSVNYVYRLLRGFKGIPYVVLTADEEKDKNIEFDSKSDIPTIRSRYIGHVLGGHWSPPKKTINYIIGNIVCLYYIFKYKPKLVYYTDISLLWISFMIGRWFRRFKVGLFTYAEEIEIARKRTIYKWLSKKGLKDADVVMTVCDYTRKNLNMIIDIDNKIKKIIPSVPMPPHKISKDEVEKNKLRILTVARLEERKGHVDMIETIAKLKDKYPNIEYSIVGRGGYEKEIRAAIDKHHLQGIALLKGSVSDEELEQEYMEADIFAMPHKQLPDGNTEGCPTVFLEAGLHYLPVVGGEAGGVSDAIIDGRTGFICHQGTNELLTAIDRLLSSQLLRKEMGEAGYEYASNFTTEKQSLKFLTLTKEILQN